MLPHLGCAKHPLMTVGDGVSVDTRKITILVQLGAMWMVVRYVIVVIVS